LLVKLWFNFDLPLTEVDTQKRVLWF